MRVLFLHQFFSTRAGSAIIRPYEMALALVRAGHETTVVTGRYTGTVSGLVGPFTKDTRSGTVDGIKVIEIDIPLDNKDGFRKRLAGYAKYVANAQRLSKTIPANVVFASSPPLTVGYPALRIAKSKRVPLVMEIRDPWPDALIDLGALRSPAIISAMRNFERHLYRTASRCVVLAPGVSEHVTAIGAQDVRFVPNGCDLDLFRPAQVKDKSLFGLKSDDIVALYAGAHGIANGLEAIVNAATVAKDKGLSRLKFVMTGAGQTKAGLIEEAQRRNLANCIFLDPVPRDRLAEMLSSADIGLMILANAPTFQRGSSPNKFFDYISAGLPVVVNHPGWVESMLEEHTCGRSVPPEDPSSLVQAIEELTGNVAEYDGMASRARSLAEGQFSRERLGREFVDAVTQWPK